MKQTYLILAFVLALVIAPVKAVQSEEKGQETDKKDKKAKVLAVFALNSPITEKPTGDDFLFGSAGSESLKDLVARMEKAGKDDSVAGVVLLIGGTSLGTGQIEEIRRAMDKIKAANKKIHVHVDSFSTGGYVLLSGASDISVVPTGDIWITGIYAESLYLRGLLDMIGVHPDFLTCGDYKSAGEMFTRSGPSKEAEENLNWLLDGIFANYVQLIAKGRGVEADQVRKWIDKGLYSAESAKQAGIIDQVQYRQDFVAQLKEQYGNDVKFDKRYGKKKRMDIDLSSPFGLFKFYADLLSGGRRRPSKQDAVAIVYVEGPILPGEAGADPFAFGLSAVAYSTPIRKALDKAANDDSVKAVVLRVNSPGGSAVGSEIILNATKRVKAKKPLVVSMGDVAGSGGYYVACGADTIFADETTITGSIGVVAGKLATAAMWQKIGITWKSTQRGANAAMLSSSDVFTEQQRKDLQAWMDEVYDAFKNHVLAIRGQRLKKEIDELAGGRVYTGRQALELGLVDNIGGLQDAIEFAADQAKAEKYEIRVIPRPRNFMELLLEDLEPKDDDPSTLSLALRSMSVRQPGLWDAVWPHLQNLDPQRLPAVKRALCQLMLLQRERIGLVMPEIQVGNQQ